MAPVSVFMSHVHRSVNQMSAVYLQNERRYNYTTPKTFLEQIALYGKLLNEKTNNLKMTITRLENGLEKLASCAGDVAVLKVRAEVICNLRMCVCWLVNPSVNFIPHI